MLQLPFPFHLIIRSDFLCVYHLKVHIVSSRAAVYALASAMIIFSQVS